VAFKGGSRDNRIYTIIAIFIVIIIIITLFWYLSISPLNVAYIENQFLDDTWSEDLEERDSGSQLLGIEKWASYTYRNNNNSYPAYVTLTSFKLLFLMNEDQLKDETIKTIKKVTNQGVIIDENTKISGERTLNNGHSTMYIIYDGNDSSGEMIKIIGETWNCGVSGTSIICIGFAQVTNNLVENFSHWTKIVRDKEGTFGLENFQGDDGLIYNVKCH